MISLNHDFPLKTKKDFATKTLVLQPSLNICIMKIQVQNNHKCVDGN